MNSSLTDFVLLDKCLTRHGFFELDTQNPTLLEPIWKQTEVSYNKEQPGSAYKTAKQLSRAYQAALLPIKKQHGLEAKKHRDEIITLWKKKIYLLAERHAAEKEIPGVLIISLCI